MDDVAQRREIRETLKGLGADPLPIRIDGTRPGSKKSQDVIRELRNLLEVTKYERRLTMLPDSGPFRRELYEKHLQFIRLGATKRQRLFMAGNKIGKSMLGAYELSCHLTGEYPQWWDGYRCPRAGWWWAAGDTGQTTRDIVQAKTVGLRHDIGTGMIPRRCILETNKKPGTVADALESAWIKHVSGSESLLTFKSFEQGRKSFQGTDIEGAWLDEEPPNDIYEETVTRTMVTEGIILVTATPLSELTPFILSFLPEGVPLQ